MANPVSEVANEGKSMLRTAWHYLHTPAVIFGGMALVGLIATTGFAGAATTLTTNAGAGLQAASNGLSSATSWLAPKLTAAGTTLAGAMPAPG